MVGAGALSAFFASQATHWAVMSDELQTSKLATSIAETLSIVPRVHGVRYGALSQQLYPLALSPWFGLLDVVAAVHTARVVNAFLFASAAWPTYLLARDVTGSRVAGCVSAALSVFVPWLVLSATLLTENVAYPVFVWAVWLCHRAIVEAGFWRDLAALVGLLLVFFARTQLFVVAIALPLALFGHELGDAVRDGRWPGTRAIGQAARRSVSLHPLLAVTYLLAVLAVAALASVGRLGGLLGNYVGTLHGELVPSGIWRAAAAHLDFVVVALGIAPFLLAGSWALVSVFKPTRREAHAFALLLLLLVPLLTFEVASFDLRFTAGGFIQDRYLLYLAPLLAIGACAGLLDRARRQARAALVLVGGVLFALLASAASFAGGAVIFWASPASAFHPGIAAMSGWVGLSPDSLVRFGAIAIALALAAVLVYVPPVTGLVAVGVVLAGFGAFEAAYVFDRYAIPATTRPRTIEGARPDWIDAANTGGDAVTLVPNPYLGEEFWWDAEFWNKTVTQALRVNQDPTFTPFPAQHLLIDSTTGRLRTALPSDVLVLTDVESRFHLAGTRVIQAAPPLVLARVDRPHRADWVTAGADPDGWVRPGRPVTLRFFPARDRRTLNVTMTVSPPPGLSRLLRLRIRTDGVVKQATLPPGAPTQIEFPVCVPNSGPGRSTLIARDGSRIADGRVVSLHIDRIDTRASRAHC